MVRTAGTSGNLRADTAARSGPTVSGQDSRNQWKLKGRHGSEKWANFLGGQDSRNS